METIALDLVQYLEGHSHPVVWIFDDFSGGQHLTLPRDILKQLAIQILKINSRLHSVRYLPRIVEHFQMASTDADWFGVIYSVLEYMPNLCVVIDLAILGPRYKIVLSWIEELSNLFERLQQKNSSILKIVFLSCWYVPNSELQLSTLDIHPKIGPPSVQRVFRGLESSGFKYLPFPIQSQEYNAGISQSIKAASIPRNYIPHFQILTIFQAFY